MRIRFFFTALSTFWKSFPVSGEGFFSFAAGLAGSLDVIDANDRAFQADIGLAAARAQVGIALAALERATARGI